MLLLNALRKTEALQKRYNGLHFPFQALQTTAAPVTAHSRLVGGFRRPFRTRGLTDGGPGTLSLANIRSPSGADRARSIALNHSPKTKIILPTCRREQY